VRRAVLAAVATAVMLTVVTGVIVYRASYGLWPWQGEPDRLSWCGRRYSTDHRDISRAEARPVSGVFRAPPVIGREVYSELSAAELSRRRRSGKICGVVLYRSAGDKTFNAYRLSGGP
jgi:hypothetical protein